MYNITVATVLTFLLLFTVTTSQTTTTSTSISSWINNQTIKYTTINGNITSIVKEFLNGSYFEIQPKQYYKNNSIYTNSSTTTSFYLAQTAYPFYFIKNMYKDGVNYCFKNTTDNSNYTQSFFFNLCYSYKTSLHPQFSGLYNNSNSTNQSLKTIATQYMSDDNFTKQLYNEYVSYSKACKSPSSTISNSSLLINTYCSGTAENYSYPNPFQFSSFYQSLYMFMQYQKQTTAAITKLMIKYDINNQTIFPILKTSQLIQPNLAIFGIYPGILPSGQQAMNMSNNATLLLPIHMLSNKSIKNLSNNYINITAGSYNNVTLIIGAQELLNKYAIYNVSLNQSPFQGTTNSGYQTYENSCYTSNPGLTTIENNEQTSVLNTIFSNLYVENFYPVNYRPGPNTGTENYYDVANGPTIVKAVYTKLKTPNETIIYGTKAYNGSIIYQKNFTINGFTTATNQYNLTLPLLAFPYKNEIIFAKMKSPFSYTMNYAEFKENTFAPNYTFNNFNYTIMVTKQIKHTKIVDNKTINYYTTIQVPKTCYVKQVATSIKHNATYVNKTSKSYNENVYRNQTLNVSTNMTTKNIFTIKNNTLQNLNYSFSYKNVKLANGQYKTYDRITVPLGTAFQLLSPNNTVLYQFDTYAFDKYLITTNYTSFYTTISKYIYAYDPSYVYPNTYSTISVLYPTIENTYNNGLYLQQFGGEQGTQFLITNENSAVLLPVGMLAALSQITSLFSSLSGSLKTNFAAAVIYNNIGEYEYYNNGCSSTLLGNSCIIKTPFYTFGQNPLSTAKTYDLLNPTVYTQGAFYAGEESPGWLCLKAEIYSVFSNKHISCIGQKSNNTISHIYIDTQELAFNTTFNVTPQEKQTFYNYLENASLAGNSTKSTYGDIYKAPYSYIQNPFIINKAFINSSQHSIFYNTEQYNINGTMTIATNKAYPVLQFDECEYNLCFTKTLTPTNFTVNTYYKYEELNSSTFLFYIQPNIGYFNYPNNSITNIKIMVGNKTYNETVGKAFEINYKNGNKISMVATHSFIQNTPIKIITVTNNESLLTRIEIPENLVLEILPYNYSKSNYTFYGLKQTMSVQLKQLYINLLFYMSIVIIILILLYFYGFYKKAYDYLKLKWDAYFDLFRI